MKKLLFIIMTYFIITPSFGLGLDGNKQDGGEAGAFLNFAPSARSLSMGRAYTALSDDADATYWNPSGLTQVNRNSIVTLYSELEADSTFGFMSYAHPTMKLGTFGFSFANLNSGAFEKRSADASPTGEAKLDEMALQFSNGYKLNSMLSLGTTLKVVRERIDVYSDTGYGLDLGLMLNLNTKWQAGIAIKNALAPQIKLRSTTESYPTDLRMGLKWLPFSSIVLSSDINQTDGRGIRFAFGGEYNITDLFSIRSGINESEIAAGVGVHLGDWGVDYAFAHANSLANTESLGDYHRLGLTLKFGRSIEDRRFEMVRVKYEKMGRKVLVDLRKRMNIDFIPKDMPVLISDAKEVIKHRGYPNPKDLYEVQGYIYFFEKNYPKSVHYIGEALNLANGVEIDLKANYEKALTFMNDEQKEIEITKLIKQAMEDFEKKKWKASIKKFEKVLLIDSNNSEALIQMEYATQYMNAPIQKAMTKGTDYFYKKRYLDAIKYFSKVKDLDPEHTEADYYMKRAIKALESAQKRTTNGRYVETIEKNVTKSREYYSQGLTHYSEGKITEALEAWEKSIQSDPSNMAAINAYNRAKAEEDTPATNRPKSSTK